MKNNEYDFFFLINEQLEIKDQYAFQVYIYIVSGLESNQTGRQVKNWDQSQI